MEQPRDYAPIHTPIIRALRGTGLYGLWEPFHYEWNGVEYTIPRGFESDGASIPRLFHRVLTPFGARLSRGAWCHDHAYRYGDMPKQDADEMLRSFILEDGLSPFLAGAVYRAVVMFGGSSYKGGK